MESLSSFLGSASTTLTSLLGAFLSEAATALTGSGREKDMQGVSDEEDAFSASTSSQFCKLKMLDFKVSLHHCQHHLKSRCRDNKIFHLGFEFSCMLSFRDVLIKVLQAVDGHITNLAHS